MKKLLLISMIVFTLSAISVLFYLEKKNSEVSPFAGMDVGGDFTLYAGDEAVSLSSFKDKVVLIFFGYTSCPDICPTTLNSIASALKQLSGSEVEQVQVLFISVDPQRDDAETLKGFTGYFHTNILGLSGGSNDIDTVVKQYATAYRKVEDGSEAGYLMDHSSAIYVINQKGELVDMLSGAIAATNIVRKIRQFL